eukprot:TRINITY_DN2413_c1_g1_i1.p1 TRINITY_DN2413_c1_g1~~TRINITY_DN2413_c1_g1_i1.p1  ORF type:complete len:551 (+),score=138.99 TRINITY_DN2413_c1_g1_i1:63-1715(+)
MNAAPAPMPTQSIVRESDSPSAIGIVSEDEDASVMVQKIAAYFKSVTETTIPAAPSPVLTSEQSALCSITRRAEDAEAEVIRLRAVNESLCSQIEVMKKEKASISTIIENTSIINGRADMVDKAEYNRLQSEYNSVLHSLLMVQREAAQLRSELLYKSSQVVTVSSTEKESHQMHSEERSSLRDRIEFLKKDHSQQIDKMNRVFDSERKEFHKKISQMVSTSELDTLRGLLRETQQQLTSVTQSRDELIDINKDAVSQSTLQAAEIEKSRRAEQIESLMEELTREKAVRTKVQESYQSMALKLEEASSTIVKINQSRGDSEAAVHMMRHQLESKETEVLELQDRYNLLQSYRKDFEQTTASLQQKTSDLAAEEVKLRIKNDSLTSDNIAMAAALTDQKDQLTSCKSIMSAQQQKLSSLELDLTDTISKAGLHQKELTDALTTTKEQLKDATNEIQTLKHSIQDKEDTIASLQKTLSSEQRRVQTYMALEDDIASLQQKQKSLEDVIATLNTKLKTKVQTLKKSEEEVANYKKLVDILKPALKEAKKTGLL